MTSVTLAAASFFLASMAANTAAGPPPITTIFRAISVSRLPFRTGSHIASKCSTVPRNAGPRSGTRAANPDATPPRQGPPVVGRDVGAAAQGVFGGAGRDRHQRSRQAARRRQEHGAPARRHARRRRHAGAESRHRQIPARHGAVPARLAGAPAHDHVERGAAAASRSAREGQRDRASRRARRQRDHVRVQSGEHAGDPDALRCRRAEARPLHRRGPGHPGVPAGRSGRAGDARRA